MPSSLNLTGSAYPAVPRYTRPSTPLRSVVKSRVRKRLHRRRVLSFKQSEALTFTSASNLVAYDPTDPSSRSSRDSRSLPPSPDDRIPAGASSRS